MRVLLLLEGSPRWLSSGEIAEQGKEVYQQDESCFSRDGMTVAKVKQFLDFPSSYSSMSNGWCK